MSQDKCGKVLKVTNPATGRWVKVLVVDVSGAEHSGGALAAIPTLHQMCAWLLCGGAACACLPAHAAYLLPPSPLTFPLPCLVPLCRCAAREASTWTRWASMPSTTARAWRMGT